MKVSHVKIGQFNPEHNGYFNTTCFKCIDSNGACQYTQSKRGRILQENLWRL